MTGEAEGAHPAQRASRRPISRRAVLSGFAGAAGITVAGAAAGCQGSSGQGVGASSLAAAANADASARSGATTRHRFRGRRQPGLLEPPQAYASFVALDLLPGAGRDEVSRLLGIWTDDIERLMDGRGPLTEQERELAAVTAALTVTVGVGPRTVQAAGAAVPTWLAPLPALPIDRLQQRWCGGDLLLQVCADSPVTVAHAHRRLVAGVAPLVRPRWVQSGFREPFEGSGLPMRNLFGQVDGTEQPALDGPDDKLLWIGDDGPAWLKDGSSLVVRRIAMDLDKWDAVDRAGRENALGRRLADGSPLTAPASSGPQVPPDLGAVDSLGFHVIDNAAHVRRAHATSPGERFLRKPYSYEQVDADGRTQHGLLFTAYQAHPVRQFLPVQKRLAQADLLNLWTTPVGSALFAILPGSLPGQRLGERMLRGS